MSFLSFAKKENEVSLLIDIGNETVSIALVSYKNKTPNFTYYTKAEFPILEESSKQRAITGLGTLLDQMLIKTLKLRKEKIDKVVVSFSSPWYTFISKEVHLAEGKDFFITKSFLESVLVREEKLYIKELSEGREGEVKNQHSVVERSIVHAKINGYVLNNMLGKKTKSFDAYLYISAISTKIEEKVVDVISKHTHISRGNISLYTSPLVSFHTIRDRFPDDRDFLLMNITGESTDFSLVKGDVIESNIQFPLGRSYIIRKIAKSAKVSSEISESMLHMYLQQKTDEVTTSLIEETLTEIEEEWAVYFEDVFVSLCKTRDYPIKIFLISDEDVVTIFSNFLKLVKTDSTALFRKNMKLCLIDELTIADLYESSIEVNPSVALVLLAIFHSRVKSNS
ncbi:MAG: hypothetical protein EXS47_00090 [Candidatus Zambryskibacteria bacterium]|nr:hypothetical protein [Candidatus Zambryskibacteria bacterium]